jgi:hypothetical protein
VLDETKKKKHPLREDLAQLQKIQAEGLLEPFVLLTMADDGIVQDYNAYRDAHRDHIKTFINEYFFAAE